MDKDYLLHPGSYGIVHLLPEGVELQFEHICIGEAAGIIKQLVDMQVDFYQV